MRLPRDISGVRLASALAVFGYVVQHQTGSHMRLETELNGEHHLTIPRHGALRVGTLAAILGEVEAHFDLTREEVMTGLALT
jgi:predicted RNA binding protein YcfA (HicA-like mRNA interferase family)